jgi:hypothetical protein
MRGGLTFEQWRRKVPVIFLAILVSDRLSQAGIFEAVFRHHDGMGASEPFAHQRGAGLET